MFGGPEFVVDYRNGDRASYVMSVFEAEADEGPKPDGREVIEARYVSQDESRSLELSRWVPEVLDAVFDVMGQSIFRLPAWLPATGRRAERGVS